ncbi:GntR family transcriptional regulator [Paracoccus xiamenensis]|uniref:GntR family transcriptional regulator n=1 Tax=Paracoccus xiamenensis TaxID=2714901 RepID=UPI00140BB707|nr:GntR family transcriptional regulator [Paracoccus xiamenensis]NHF73225.1 GntR family transcriptional regulator [Paracoccus xiamenensis]
MPIIDRTSTEPYYLQLADIIEQRIKSGALKSGERIPGESELCRSYDLARSTVRDTFRVLEQRRLIRIVPRRGAFVSDQSDNRWKLQVTEGFLETAAHAPDVAITTSVLEWREGPLPDPAASALGLALGTIGFGLERLRFLDGLPAVYSTNWMPLEVGRTLIGKPVLQGTQSLNATLRSAGYLICQARREVAAVIPPPEAARYLQVSRNFPVLLIKSMSRDMSGTPFDYYESYARSDVVAISVDAQAVDGTGAA